MNDLDGARILAEARQIAFPRYPGTAGDRRAVSIVSSKLREAGLEVVEEEFSYDIRIAFRVLRAALASCALLVGLAGAIASVSPPAALLPLGLAVLAGGTLLAGFPGAERLYDRPGPTSTKNVTGYRRAAAPRRRLVLMAHHDSKSQNLSFPWRMGWTLLALLGGSGLLALLTAGLAGGGLPGPDGAAPLLGGATAIALLVLSTLRSGNESPGGVDNAGSVAILLALARTLPREVPEEVELVFLSTGAEEDHMVGAMRWLAAHRSELGSCPLQALNFDGAGAEGKTVLIERYGLGRRFAPTVSRAARAAAAGLDQPFRSILMPPAMGVDAIPFAPRGVECLTLSSGRLDRAAISVHSANDVAKHLDAATLEGIAWLARATVHELVSAGGAGRARRRGRHGAA